MPLDLFTWRTGDGNFFDKLRSEAREASANANARDEWKETPEAHDFKADLPGPKKEEVKVKAEEGRILRISGERSKEKDEKNDKWDRIEMSRDDIQWIFSLLEDTTIDELMATWKNGVPTVTPPEEEKKKSKVKSN